MIVLMYGMLFGMLYLFVKVYELLTNRYFSNSKWFLFICVVGLAALAAQMKPPLGWDLYRHYEEIDQMRLLGADYAWTDSKYSKYISITALFYFVSLTPWNSLLVFIAIFAELSIMETMLNYYRRKGLSAQTSAICFFLFLALSNIVLAISGIRNVLAATLMGFALWNFQINRKKGLIPSALLIAIAVTIHPASGLIMIIYIISYIPMLPIAMIVAAFILPVLSNVLIRFENSPNTILSSSAELFAFYVEKGFATDRRVNIIAAGFIVAAVVLLLYRFYVAKEKTRYTRFSLAYCVGTLGMFTQGVIFTRMLYGLNCIMLVLLAKECVKGNGDRIDRLYYVFKLCCMVYFIGMLAFQGYELINAIKFYHSEVSGGLIQ